MANITAELTINGKIDVTGDLKGTITPGGGAPTLQEKTVHPMVIDTTYKPEDGYDGFSQVTVQKAELQTKLASAATYTQHIRPDLGYYGLKEVEINKMNLQNKTFVFPPRTGKTTITADAGYTAIKSIDLYAPTLKPLEVMPSDVEQVFEPDNTFFGYNKVTVAPASGGDIPEICTAIIPAGVFESAVVDALSLPMATGIVTGAFAGINGNSHFDLYLNDSFYVIPSSDGSSSGTIGYPFGEKADVTVHVPESMRSRYSGSSWEEFVYEHDGFELVYE